MGLSFEGPITILFFQYILQLVLSVIFPEIICPYPQEAVYKFTPSPLLESSYQQPYVVYKHFYTTKQVKRMPQFPGSNGFLRLGTQKTYNTGIYGDGKKQGEAQCHAATFIFSSTNFLSIPVSLVSGRTLRQQGCVHPLL